MISHLLNSFLVGILFMDMLERRFPQEFRNVITDLSFKLLYLYSKTQIYISKSNKKFNNFIESNPTLLKIKNELDAIIKQPIKLIPTIFVKNGEEFYNIETHNNDYDFALISWQDVDKKYINKRIIHDKNDFESISECSDIKFILVEVQIGLNSPHKINLKTDEYNYYIVGNKFTKQFFIYYLKKYLKINETISADEKFSLKIIDHDINTISVDFTDKNESILLEKNGYKLSITNHHNE